MPPRPDPTNSIMGALLRAGRGRPAPSRASTDAERAELNATVDALTGGAGDDGEPERGQQEAPPELRDEPPMVDAIAAPPTGADRARPGVDQALLDEFHAFERFKTFQSL